MINYGLVYKGCRCGTGILDVAVFTAMRQKLRRRSLLLRAAAHCMPSHGETGAVKHVADHGPVLCVALLKWEIFLTEKVERYSPGFVVNDREAV